MPRSCGPNSPYGCGHHHEHVEAARKGWITRRGGGGIVERADAKWFREVFPGTKYIHTDSSHPKSVMFKKGKTWYELPVSEFRELAAAGREDVRERRKRELSERAERRYHHNMEQVIFKQQYEGYHELMRDLRKKGIRAPEKTHYNYRTGKYYGDEEEELYDAFPKSMGIVRRNGHYTPEQASEAALESVGYNLFFQASDRTGTTLQDDEGGEVGTQQFYNWVKAMRAGKLEHQAKRYDQEHEERIARQEERARRAAREGKSA